MVRNDIRAERIEMMFRWMDYDYLSDKQHDFIISLEKYYNKHGFLTVAQADALESIFRQAAEAPCLQPLIQSE